MIVISLRRLSQAFLFGLALVLTPLATVAAQETVVDMVLNSCKKELTTYCNKVTPGRGRIVACLYGHSDKLAEPCSLAVEVGVVQLNMILSAVSHVLDQCSSDLDNHCGDVEIGGGAMYQCMKKNEASLEPQCKAAFLQAEEDLK